MSERSLSDPSRSTFEQFIRSLPAEGLLQTPDGRRVAALPEALMHTLHRGLGDAGADHTRHLLYRAGYEWGLQDMLHLSTRMREESGSTATTDLWKMDAPFVLERWSAPFAAAGWGACIFDLSFHAKGITFVELRHSAAAAAVGHASAPVCHLYAGLFAGALSFYDRVESHGVETECAALGHACCRFIVGPGPVVDQAESARHSGIAHDAIRRLVLEARAPQTLPLPATPSPAAAATPAAKAAKIPWKK
jgi:predicted hydrocarbon binding protein